MSGKRVLVTGAGGLIGLRLVSLPKRNVTTGSGRRGGRVQLQREAQAAGSVRDATQRARVVFRLFANRDGSALAIS
jgi:hypothetical protein